MAKVDRIIEALNRNKAMIPLGSLLRSWRQRGVPTGSVSRRAQSTDSVIRW